MVDLDHDSLVDLVVLFGDLEQLFSVSSVVDGLEGCLNSVFKSGLILLFLATVLCIGSLLLPPVLGLLCLFHFDPVHELHSGLFPVVSLHLFNLVLELQLGVILLKLLLLLVLVGL